MTFKNKINLSIAIFIILIIILFVFLIYPTFLEIKKSSQNFLSQKQNLISLEKKAENLEKFKTYYQQIESNLEKIDGLFINPEVPVDFISFLEKTSKDCQMTIKISSAPSVKTEKDLWPSLSFQISSVTPFPNFLKFLEKLESSIYLIEIQNLNVIRIGETELKSKEYEKLSLGDVKANLSIKIYTK